MQARCKKWGKLAIFIVATDYLQDITHGEEKFSYILIFSFISNIFVSAFKLLLYQNMEYLDNLTKPSKEEQKVATVSYNTLTEVLERLHEDNPEIEIEETREKIKIPLRALKLLAKILKITSQGKPVSIVPIATEMTTQAAADLLGCSRPHLVKILEEGEIEYTTIGKHRRVKFEDVMDYKKKMKAKQEELLIKIMNADEESGLYDT